MNHAVSKVPAGVPSTAAPAIGEAINPGSQSAFGVIPDVAGKPGTLFSVYLHAFRRRWWIGLSIGIACGALAGVAVWFGMVPQYTATAKIRIASQQERIVFDTIDMTTQSSFDTYKNTQSQLVKSRFVLVGALRNPEVAELPIVREQVDAVAWLAKEPRVSFPMGGEIMEVSLTADDPNATTKLVNAVVDSYMKEVAERESKERLERKDELEKHTSQKEEELRLLRNQLYQLQEQSGTGETETLSTMERIAIQELERTGNLLAERRTELELLKMEQELWQTMQEATADGSELSDSGLDAMLKSDPAAWELSRALDALERKRRDIERTLRPEVAKSHLEAIQADRQALEEQIERRREELRQQALSAGSDTGLADIRRIQLQIPLLEEEVQKLDQDYKKQQQRVDQLGKVSVDVLQVRTTIELETAAYQRIATELLHLKTELGSRPRIEKLESARPPRVADRRNRLALTLFAVMAGILGPVAVVTWWDARSDHVNSPLDVSGRIHVDVLGTLPAVPVQAVRQPATSSKRHRRWRSALQESVDTAAAMLVHKAESQQMRVLMVTSAARGEGKTTLATQLAASLARGGYRTALVDFDLRRPDLNGVFGLALSPGVSEFLREKSDLTEVVRDTSTTNLSVLTAGSWDPIGQAVLRNGAVSSLFSKLREQYDFVIIDAGPLLPLADTRVIGQSVDGVILSIRRDVSRAPRVMAACEVLAAMEIPSLGAVVIGSTEDVYYDYEEDRPKGSVQ